MQLQLTTQTKSVSDARCGQRRMLSIQQQWLLMRRRRHRRPVKPVLIIYNRSTLLQFERRGWLGWRLSGAVVVQGASADDATAGGWGAIAGLANGARPQGVGDASVVFADHTTTLQFKGGVELDVPFEVLLTA
jgi:hypothetical protein